MKVWGVTKSGQSSDGALWEADVHHSKTYSIAEPELALGIVCSPNLATLPALTCLPIRTRLSDSAGIIRLSSRSSRFERLQAHIRSRRSLKCQECLVTIRNTVKRKDV